MKLIFKLALCLAALIQNSFESDCKCSDAFYDITCFDPKLESEKPFHFNESIYKSETNECRGPISLSTVKNVDLYDPTGSIDHSTFSMLPDLERLKIHGDVFDDMEDGALCSPPKLKELVIVTIISSLTLTHSSLSNCGNLKKLSVFAFPLNLEPDVFKSMTNLEELNLSPRHISHLTKEHLITLKKLKKLKVVLEGVDSGAVCSPPQLEVLQILARNMHQTITPSTLNNCQHIKELYIEEFKANPGEITVEGAFSAFTNVKVVTFNSLNFTHLKKKQLTGLNNVENLTITSSKLTKIDSDIFADFSNLKSLDLALNELSQFDSDIIKSLPHLKKLDLSHNKLENIDKITHPVLEHLVVSENSIKKVDVNAIKMNLPNLKKLEIGCNLIPVEDKRVLKEELQGISATIDKCLQRKIDTIDDILFI